MKSMTYERLIVGILGIVCAACGLASCADKPEIEPLDLPATYVLNTNASWAVITSSHLRLRERPTATSTAITTLWKGNVLEIISKKGIKETVDEKNDYWYQISYGGLQGWVFGAYLNIFETKERAEAMSEELNR